MDKKHFRRLSLPKPDIKSPFHRDRQERSAAQEGRPFRLWIFRKRRWAASAAVALALLMAAAVYHPLVVGASAAARQLPIYCVRRNQKLCSLTFDAAWGAEDTQQLIDILGQYSVTATFFVVGDWVEKYPEAVKALFDAGHEVMNHSNDHAHFNTLSARQIVDDINACNDKIEAVTGIRPTLFRPPYGEYNDNVVTTVRSMGMEPIQWDVDSLDWKNLSAADITRRVTEKVRPGSIILFHNAALNTPAALPSIIESLIQNGYGFAPVSELLLSGDYVLDHTGRQCPANQS